jgi:colanic acid/amylovoran biosynthesis glycosyltransferase
MHADSETASGSRPAVAHFRHLWFQPTETFLHTTVRAFRRSAPLLIGYERIHADAFPVDCPVLPLYPRGSWRARWNSRCPEWLGGDVMSRFDTRATRDALERHGARVLHAHFGFTGFQVLALKRRTGLPLVTTFYGSDASQRALLPGWRERYAELFAEGELFLAEGPHLADRLVALGCPRDKIAIHPIVIEPERYGFRERRPRAPGDPVRLFFCARLREKKGLEYALQALARTREKHPEVILHIGGDGPEEPRARALVDELGLDDAVRFLGFLSHDRFLSELSAADLFIQPSVTARDGDSEGGAPTTLLEAQACGLPILATTHADIPNVVRHERSGLLSPERDVDALTEHLLELLANPNRWAPMGQAGRQHIEAHHNALPQTATLEDHYQSLVTTRTTNSDPT